LGLQLASIAEQLLRSGSAVVLPRLAEAAATQETMPAPFYLAVVWDLAFYAGGIGFVVSQAMLAPLVVYAAGASFSEVDDVFVNFGWLIIPLLICFGLRQMLISQGLQARYLVAVIVGSGAESVAVLGWLIWFAPQAKDLLGLLAIGYAGVAMTALVLIKSAPQQIAWTPNATAPLITLMMLLLYSRYHSVDPIMWSVIVTLLLGTSGSLSIRRLLQLVRVPRIS
jgi:hypothetical protein